MFWGQRCSVPHMFNNIIGQRPNQYYSLKNIGVHFFRAWGDNTHPCRCPLLTVNGFDLTPPTLTQISDHEYNSLDGQ